MNERIRNERIQALAVEAEDYADGIVDQGGEFHPAYTRKLAELIVQECIEVCKKQEYEYWRSPEDQEYTPQDCADAIARHFGVDK